MRASFGTTTTGNNTSHGRSYGPCDSQSSPSCPSYGGATFYYTRTTQQSWLHLPSLLHAPRHDDGIATVVALVGCQRHPHPAQVHSLDNEHMGKQPLPGARPRRLIAKPETFQLPSGRVRTTLYRPFRVNGQHAAPPLHCQIARPQ
jgi:hypothetical protein